MQELTLNENFTEDEKLKKTINIRCDILKEKHTELREVFPFYFVSPEIVSLKLNWIN